MHLEIVKSCMAADVMMGHDPDCARWIKRFREATAAAGLGGGRERPGERGGAGAARAGTRRAARARHEREGRTRRLHAFRQKRGRFPLGTQLLAGRVISASTSTRSAADAPLCGRCQGAGDGGRFSPSTA